MRSKTKIGAKIFQLRKEMKLTQGELASKVGVSRAAISQFELGDTLPSFETQEKLSKALDFDFAMPWLASPSLDKVRDEYVNLAFWPISAYPFLTSLANGVEDGIAAIPMKVSDNEMPVLVLSGVEYVSAQIIEIKGDAMAPRYPAGARYVIKSIDAEDDVLRLARGPHLFILKDNEPFIRRIVSTTRGVLTLRADASGDEMEFGIKDIQDRWKVGTCHIFKLGQAVHMPAEE